MSSLFKKSETIGAQHLHDKVLFWGPQHTGKTHVSLTWPAPVLVDVETRGAHFAERFKFLHAEVTTTELVGQAFREIQKGGLPCDTIVVDSATAIYYKLIEEHTTRSEKDGKVSYTTDWVTVNRRMLNCMNFVFGLAGKNVIFTAHAGDKLVRQGRDFTKAGTQFVGDQKFRYAFDYVFRMEPTGNDPRTSPAMFIVEKSASPNLKIGDRIKGLDYAKFIELTRGKKQPSSQAAPPLKGEALADAQTTGSAPLFVSDEPVDQKQAHALGALLKRVGAERMEAVVLDVTNRRTKGYLSTNKAEAEEIIKRLGALSPAGAA